MNSFIFHNLHAEEYEHEYDKAALNKLHKTPGLEIITKKFLEMGLEKRFFLQVSSSCIKCSKNTFPKEMEILRKVCEILCLDGIPDMYVLGNVNVGSQSFGVERSMIVLNSGSIDKLNENELKFLIGHEVGHLKSKHILYHQIEMVFPVIASALGNATLGLSKIPAVAVQMALSRWNRASELTADRAGFLACQDINIVFDAFMKISGLPEKYQNQIKRKDFIDQIKDYKDFDFNTKDKLIVYMTMNLGNKLDIINQDTITRAAFLLKWYKSGDFKKLFEKNNNSSTIIDQNVLKCTECGAETTKEDNFCASCGKKLG